MSLDGKDSKKRIATLANSHADGEYSAAKARDILKAESFALAQDFPSGLSLV
jgi:hypothetical protein